MKKATKRVLGHQISQELTPAQLQRMSGGYVWITTCWGELTNATGHWDDCNGTPEID